ncbi:MAG: YkgJ family cysteine cluster protein [Deltaproteobacteria bacterium]|jgi:Fe-S-cluster containining protein
MEDHSSRSSQFDPASLQDLFQSGKRKDFIAQVRLALRQILVKLQVESHYDQVIPLVKREPGYRELNNSWQEMKPPVRRQKWNELMERAIQIAYSTRPYCLRCGECCRLGSPSLHLEDAELLARGLISTRQIYTLRRGEPVSLNVEGKLGTLPSELIKFKEDQEQGYCRFYSEDQKSCDIYKNRPSQCRFQQCWNPEALESRWREQKLTRRDIVKDDQDLMELLELHDERCNPERLNHLFIQLHNTGDMTVLDQVLEILRQDLAIRSLATTKLNRHPEELDFLLGRPLAEIVRSYGLRVEKDQDGIYHLLQDR